jgi:TonB family protein
MLSRCVFWSVLAVGSVLTPLVRAADDAPRAADDAPRAADAAEPSEAEDVLIPPSPVDTPIEYPEGESTSASVTLELTLDERGSVRSARVTEGGPPFAAAAERAVTSWQFRPALRRGKPVAARIRYTIRFVPPAVPGEAPDPAGPAAAPPTSTKLAPKPPAAAESAPVGIVIEGARPAPGSVTVTREESRELPGSFGDPLRAIEAQPGVVPIVSGLPAFFIRGAPPANVGFFVDGVDIPVLYHAFFGPSVLHPELIDSVEFYPGAAPVQYGRFAGPVVAVKRRPFLGRRTGQATLRAIDAGVMIESPFDPECNGREACSKNGARVAGRYSYAGLVLSALSDAKLDYWDYQAEVAHALGPRDTIGVFAFGAYDYFRPPTDAETSGGEVEFHRVDVRYDHAFAADTNLRLALTGGYDRAGGAVEDSSVVTNRALRGRAEFTSKLSPAILLRAGFDARVDRFGLETNPLLLSYPDYSALFPERTEGVVGAYVGAEIAPTRRINVSPGVRVDAYHSQGVTVYGIDPRIAAAFDVRRNVTIEHSLGILHQRPNFAAQVPGAQVADLAGGLQYALLFSSGVRTKLPAEFQASVSAFRAAYFRALDPIGGARDFTIDRTVLDRRSTVSAAGLEFEIRRSLTRRLGGFVSYTLSRSEQSLGGMKSVSGFDRPHVVQAAVSYDFGRGVRAGTRAVVYSGVPELNLEGSPHFTTNRRGRAYFRIDVRAEKRFRLGRSGYLSAVAEVLNASSTREVVRLDCGEVCVERVAGPVVLPSIGIEAGF